MPSTKDIVLGGPSMFLFKGEPGMRKTCVAASFPGPIYFFDCDGRMRPVKLLFPDRDDITYDTYTSEDYVKLSQKLESMVNGQCPYKTVVLDSLTSLADIVIAYSKGVRGNENKANSNRQGIISLNEIEDFGAENAAITRILDAARVMVKIQKINFILTAHVMETSEKDFKTKVTTISRTLLTGGKKVAVKIPVYFDEMWHFDSQKNIQSNPPSMNFRIVTQHAGDDSAKTALPLPPSIDITNRRDVYNLIQEYVAAYEENLRKEAQVQRLK